MRNFWLLSDTAFTIFTSTVAKEKRRWLLIERMWRDLRVRKVLSLSVTWIQQRTSSPYDVGLTKHTYLQLRTLAFYTFIFLPKNRQFTVELEFRQLTSTTALEQQVEHYQAENNNTSVSTVAHRSGAGAPRWYTLRCSTSPITIHNKPRTPTTRKLDYLAVRGPSLAAISAIPHGRSWHRILLLPAMYPSIRRRKRNSSKRSSTICS